MYIYIRIHKYIYTYIHIYTGTVGSAVKAFQLVKNSCQITAINSINKETFDSKIIVSKKNKKRDRTEDDDEDDINLASNDALALDNEGKDSLYESVVALLCQTLEIKDASVLAVEAISSAEANKGCFTSIYTLLCGYVLKKCNDEITIILFQFNYYY
jgi:hypothetical protein